MKKRATQLLMTGFMGAACLIVGYALWTSGGDVADDHDHDHHHDHAEEYLHFPIALATSHGIAMEQAMPGTLQQRVRAPAQISVVSDQIAHVIPKVPGIVVKANKNLGERVTRNEVLAVFDSKEMAEMKSNYLAALKKIELAETTFARESNLNTRKLNSAQDFHDSENARDQAQIELELARQTLHALGMSYKKIEALTMQEGNSLKRYELRSPISGQVIARDLTPGQQVDNSSEVYVVADLSVVWGEVNVSAYDRQYIKVGQPVTINDDRGNSVDTVVSYLSPIIDPATRTSRAIVTIPNVYETWLPGTFAQAEFITHSVDVPVSVARDAIQNIDGVDVVFVADGDGFAVRPVTLGRSDDLCCEIIAGVKPGEKYASSNTFLLKADLIKDEAEHMD